VSGQDEGKKPVRSGQVRHDKGGRAIWEWAVDSGRHAIDSTSRLLKKLDLTSLRLLGDDEKPWDETTQQQPRVESRPAAEEPKKPVPTFGGPRESDPLQGRKQSFNPYDSRSPTGRGAAPSPRPATPPRPRVTQPVKPAAKPGLLGKLFGRK
jgi:hypothetical protein